MRRIVIGFMSTVSALVLLFSYHTSLSSSSAVGLEPASDTTDSGGAAVGAATSDSGSTSSTPDATATASAGTGSSGSGSSSSSGTYTGDAVNTRWGVVQVKITVKDGKITKSEAVQYPTENPRDQEINSYAVPQLNSEVVARQSGTIDALSGATVTSDGYIQSVQSAIDQANL